MRPILRNFTTYILLPFSIATHLTGCSSPLSRPDDSPTSQWLQQYDQTHSVLDISLPGQTVEAVEENNLIRLALQNNPHIQAGRYSSEYVRLLAEYTKTQYQPQISARVISDYRRTQSVAGEGDFRDVVRRNHGRSTSEVTVSQRFPNGIEGKIFVDLENANDFKDDYGDAVVGVEVGYLIPGLSYTLAERQLSDLIRLQEPAKDRAGFVAGMRSKLDDVVNQYYADLRTSNDLLGVEQRLFNPHLLHIRSILGNRLAANPSDGQARSDIQRLEGLIANSETLIGTTLPTEIRKSERNLLSDLGLQDSTILYEPITDPPFELDYAKTLRAVIANDPEIGRLEIELAIAKAQADAANKQLDVKVFAGGFRGVESESDGEAYVGASLTWNPSGRDLLEQAYGMSRLSFTAKMRGRISDLTSSTYRTFRNIEYYQSVMEKARTEKERKRVAFDETFTAFEQGAAWASFDRVVDLLKEWTESEVSFLDSRKRITLNRYYLLIRMGAYDRYSDQPPQN